MKEISLIFDQDDIDKIREEGFIKSGGVYFEYHSPTLREHDHDRSVWFNESTLYQEGEAVWKTAIDNTVVRVKYDRPSIERWIESEREQIERQRDRIESIDNGAYQDEWLAGRSYTLACLEGFCDGQ